MFSKACTYSIRAMIFIVTRTADGSRVSIRDIAHHTGTPEPFVAKILQALSRKGIGSSRNEPSGGFYVDAGANDVPLIDIVRASDVDSLFFSCWLGIRYCSEKKPCPIIFEHKAIRGNILYLLKINTILSLSAGVVN